MKKLLFIIVASLSVMFSCTKYPIDEDNLLITDRTSCYVGNFEVLGEDFQVVRSQAPVIDTLAQTINVEVNYGTNLKKIWPQFSLVTDAKLEPKITGFVDFSDLKPKQWTVISGNRKIKKVYTVTLTVAERTYNN